MKTLLFALLLSLPLAAQSLEVCVNTIDQAGVRTESCMPVSPDAQLALQTYITSVVMPVPPADPKHPMKQEQRWSGPDAFFHEMVQQALRDLLARFPSPALAEEKQKAEAKIRDLLQKATETPAERARKVTTKPK